MTGHGHFRFLLVPAALLMVLWANSDGAAQTVPDSVPDTVQYVPDEALSRYAAVSDTVNREARLIQSPTGALFKSLLVPGWGQIGNHKYFKALIYGGLEVLFIGAALNYKFQAQDDWDTFADLSARGKIDSANAAHATYTDHKNRRNRYTWYAAITVFVSMFDAYVDAHLSGFPKVDKHNRVGVKVGPDDRSELALSLAYRF